jgi:hypothetical protein
MRRSSHYPIIANDCFAHNPLQGANQSTLASSKAYPPKSISMAVEGQLRGS